MNKLINVFFSYSPPLILELTILVSFCFALLSGENRSQLLPLSISDVFVFPLVLTICELCLPLDLP